ncbi:uncharacterized protein LOC113769263 [Coffea eugenioides]|uniref:uncharacterized protein LOC113769263 n=1 Tax=Coffea eugenioides TaxID=49369 RepID=UPI000F5CB345|nr:uncharacterized protein LOC113740979 [Coffea arabica]XP_027169527.1 uncharacterized protein LOC113769263 [Coffea eugenioides]
MKDPSDTNQPQDAIITVLKTVWDKGYNKVVIETDSKVSLKLIDGDPNESPLLAQINQIRGLKERRWECEVIHQWREGNLCADWLTKRSLSLEPGVLKIVSPPEELRKWLAYDVVA